MAFWKNRWPRGKWNEIHLNQGPCFLSKPTKNDTYAKTFAPPKGSLEVVLRYGASWILLLKREPTPRSSFLCFPCTKTKFPQQRSNTNRVHTRFLPTYHRRCKPETQSFLWKLTWSHWPKAQTFCSSRQDGEPKNP